MAKNNEHPSGDSRYKALDRVMKRSGYSKDALLEVLNTAQETFGFLSEELLHYVANKLNVPVSRVYGVSTFYHLFTFEPLGKHNCVVCTGTACHVKGAGQVVAALEDEFGIGVGETTEDKEFSLSIARCLGSCGLAPVVVLDSQVVGKVEADTVVQVVKDSIAVEVEGV